MSLITWKPKTEMDPWTDTDPFFPAGFFSSGRYPELKTESVKVNVRETDNEFLMQAEVPGMSENDIVVEVKDGMLYLKGETRKETTQEKETWHYKEFSHKKFERTFRLGDGLDGENIQAHLDKGVLQIVIPKKEATKPRKIDIKGVS